MYHKIKNHKHTQRVLTNKHFLKYEKWALLIIWAGAIYYLSSKSLEFVAATGTFEFILRKLAHMFEFGVLTFLIFRILGETEKRHMYWNLGWSFVFAVLYAISDEYHQSLVPGRVGIYKDVLIDSVGIIIATWLIYIDYHHKKILRQVKNKATKKTV